MNKLGISVGEIWDAGNGNGIRVSCDEKEMMRFVVVIVSLGGERRFGGFGRGVNEWRVCANV